MRSLVLAVRDACVFLAVALVGAMFERAIGLNWALEDMGIYAVLCVLFVIFLGVIAWDLSFRDSE